MLPPFVILVGFSTTGKSHFLKEVKSRCNEKFHYKDSDQFVSRLFNNHIYNIFMEKGSKDALKYIEEQENEFIMELSKPHDKPLLVSAGPFLVIREGWKDLITITKTPYIIHIEKSVPSIYDGLCERRRKHMNELDISHPNFGSWDNGVLTMLENGKYVEMDRADSLASISKHFKEITKYYVDCRDCAVDGDNLRNSSTQSNEVIELIISKLAPPVSV